MSRVAVIATINAHAGTWVASDTASCLAASCLAASRLAASRLAACRITASRITASRLAASRVTDCCVTAGRRVTAIPIGIACTMPAEQPRLRFLRH